MSNSCGVYELRQAHGHVEVFLDDVFLFSADTIKEAEDDIEEFVKEVAQCAAV